jgi:hypothetical protein
VKINFFRASYSSGESGRDVGENLVAETSACPFPAECPNIGKTGAVMEEVTSANHHSDHPLDKIFGDIPARLPAFPHVSVRYYGGL